MVDVIHISVSILLPARFLLLLCMPFHPQGGEMNFHRSHFCGFWQRETFLDIVEWWAHVVTLIKIGSDQIRNFNVRKSKKVQDDHSTGIKDSKIKINTSAQ